MPLKLEQAAFAIEQSQAPSLSPGHLRALHTLCGIYAAQSLDFASADERHARLEWASGIVGHRVASFRDLTDLEAGTLIDTLKRALGQQVNASVRSARRHRLDNELAQAAGTHGRRARRDNKEIMAGADDVAAIDALRARLGWSLAAFDAWLSSPRSPLAGRSDHTLRTWSDCNRVRWALKAMLKRAGLWAPSTNRATIPHHSGMCAGSLGFNAEV